MAIKLEEHDFDNPEALAHALAADVANFLRAGIAARGQALIALSGGTTPRRFLQVLAEQPVDWSRTTVTLADDRWVPPSSPRSNERLVRETLLRGAAAVARFVPLYVDAPTPEQGCTEIAARVAKLPFPFDAVLLGMGNDGHCASLFADGDHIDAALQPGAGARVMPMHAPSAGEPRITLTLAALTATRSMYLHIEGAEKDRTLAGIRDGDPAFAHAPVRNVLEHSPVTPMLFRCR